MQVPTNLIDSSLNNSAIKSEPCQLFPRHMKLQEKFLALRAVESLRSDGLNLESTYSGEVGQIEVSRYQALCAAGISNQHRRVVNHHHDQRRLNLINQYEAMLQQVLNTKELEKNTEPVSSPVENKPLLTSDRGVIKMAFPHKTTVQVARQLAFSSNSDLCAKRPNSPDSVCEVASSPECLEVDFSQENLSEEETDSSMCRTQTVLGDSGICEDDASSYSSDGGESHSETTSCHQNVTPCVKNLPVSTSNSVLQPFDTNRHTELLNRGNVFKRNTDFQSDGYKRETVKSDIRDNSISADRPPNKRKRDLELSDENYLKKQIVTSTNRGKKITAESTFILSKWYNEHIRYPYPSDLEVEQLAEQTELSPQQIKKWMANKRVRNYNTLSITGNQHPIKFKFKGQRYAENGQDAKSSNYKQLHPEARRVLGEWYDVHMNNPYPSDEEKSQLAERAGITEQQVKSWFANKRSRANNTKKQVPNYFIKKFPEYTRHVQMVSLTRELARKSRKTDSIDSIIQCAYRN